MGLRDRIAALLGVSAFRKADRSASTLDLDDPLVVRMRELHGGQLGLMPRTRTRWYLHDIETAEHMADAGDLSLAAQLMRSARADGTYGGVLSTRTGGLVRLPIRFRGPTEVLEELQQKPDDARSLFDEMCPATELALLAADGEELGVGVAELVPVAGRAHPVLVRLDPQFLRYRWEENQWHYLTIAGPVAITPGDGRWVLHIPGGRVSPWQHGFWRAVGKSHVRKEHAKLRKDNWEGKLANSARVATAPHGATEQEQQSWFEQVMAWGVNTVFGMKPGYDVKLVESNGIGHESFEKTIADENDELKMVVAGQLVTSDGGAGFQNSDIHKAIRADLIKSTADGLAHTVNTQVLPPWLVDTYGEEALDEGVAMAWDVEPPKDRNNEASALTAVAGAVKSLTEALAPYGMKPDVAELAARFGVPLEVEGQGGQADVPLKSIVDLAQARGLQLTEDSVRALAARAQVELELIPKGDEAPRRLDLAPTDLAKIVRGREARASQGLEPFGDERDDKTVTELGEKAEASGEVEVVEAEAEAQPEPAKEAA